MLHKTLGGDAFVKLEAAIQCQVNAGRLIEMGMGHNALWLGADEEAGEVHAVAADVHEGAATRLAPVAWIVPVAPAGGPVAADVQDPADSASGDDAFGFGDLRMEAMHEPFHQPALARVSGGEHLLDLGTGTGKRLLAKNVFAGFECAHGPFAVQPVVQRVNDDVDFGIVNQGLVTRMRARDAMLDAGEPWLVRRRGWQRRRVMPRQSDEMRPRTCRRSSPCPEYRNGVFHPSTCRQTSHFGAALQVRLGGYRSRRWVFDLGGLKRG